MNATSPSLQRGITVFKENIDAPIASFFNSCVRCGMCATACLFYETTKDPKYTPIHKLEPMRRIWKQEYTFWGRFAKALGISKPVTDDDLEQWQELLYDSCTLCGRCSLICPIGNDLVYMLGGGQRSHIGSVVMKIPQKEVIIMKLEGHYDQDVLIPIAEAAPQKYHKKVVALGGIHIDNASKEDRKSVV